jgi:hypothetical protein
MISSLKNIISNALHSNIPLTTCTLNIIEIDNLDNELIEKGHSFQRLIKSFRKMKLSNYINLTLISIKYQNSLNEKSLLGKIT